MIHPGSSAQGALLALSRNIVVLCAVMVSMTVLAAADAQARCGDLPSDFEAIETVRARLSNQCSCVFAIDRNDFMRCSRRVIDRAVDDGTLPRACKSTVRRCQAKSTCGKPGSVTCCRTNSRGTTRCAIKRDASRCTAPRNGAACTSDFTSCCDACGPAGCLYRPTPTPAPTPTIPAICQEQIGLPSLGNVPFGTRAGSIDCASDPPAPPISGHVEDESGNVIKELGAGCLYTGGLPGSRIADGGTANLSATGINGLTVTLGPSDGTGPFNCTNGAGPDVACLNGAPGLDGNGACIEDSDCGVAIAGVCAPRANCYFGPPSPVRGLAPVCTVNSFLAPLCGQLDLATRNVTMTTALTASIFVSGNAATPCPQCIDGACTGGPRVGLACTPIGSNLTSIDCPPPPEDFFAKLTIFFSELTNGTSTLTADSAGIFCPGQTAVGAFALPDARYIEQIGTGLGGSGLGAPFQTTLVGVFCIPSSGNFLIDFAGGFPAAGAFSSVGEIDLSGVLGLPPLP